MRGSALAANGWVVAVAVGASTPAFAAPVVCDSAEAARLLVDARIDERRVPVTHPWLVPGLARRAGDARGAPPGQAAVAAAVAEECAAGGELVVERAEQVEQGSWAAYVVVLSRAERQGCSLVHHRLPISVGFGPTAADTTYGLRGELPPERTPLDGCPEPAVWRSQTQLAGGDGAVRLFVVADHRGDAIEHSHVAVRTASPTGWREQVLLDPAPPRLLDPSAGGPLVALASTRDDETLIVASHDRHVGEDGACTAVGGQVVWRRGPEGVWSAIAQREALTLLAQQGLWRFAGDDGWLLILAQDDEDDRDLVGPRTRRLQRRDPEPLYVLTSSSFPMLYAGFVVITPAPWPTEAEAFRARGRWGRSGWAYVKRAWQAADPCASAGAVGSR